MVCVCEMRWRSSIEPDSVYDTSAMSSARSATVERRRAPSSATSSARLPAESEREKHVFSRVRGRPGTSTTAASENVHSSVARAGSAGEAIGGRTTPGDIGCSGVCEGGSAVVSSLS